MNILYIHGYNGNMYGNSYHHLKRHIELDNQRMYDLLTSRGHVILADPHSTKLHSIDYDPEQPERAIQSIKQYVADNQIDLIIGASLGGFLAMHIFGIPRIVVNPCWDPAVELPIGGYTGDTTVYQRLLNELLENINEKESRLCAGCFAANDELLGTRYKSEFEKHFQHTFDISDGHKITDTSAQEIIDYASMRMLRPLRYYYMETSIIGEIDKQLVIMVYTDDTGDIPYFHIIDKETSGNTFHACVKIAQAQYFHHTGKENVLDSNQQESLVKFLTSECDLGISYWHFLLMTWNTNNANNKVNIDYNMPDYTSIENS